MKLIVAEEELICHPYRATYWEREKTLLVADLHLGKVDHFRKSGLFVPAVAAMDNYERLSSLMLEFDVERLIIVGDLFHSSLNADWKNFAEFRSTFEQVQLDLVLGNHDILQNDLWEINRVTVTTELREAPFSFSHYQEDIPGTYNISGHLHPGVRLIGAQGHSLKLPCFYFGADHGVLPAFGTFTGIAVIEPVQKDQVVVITEDELIAF